MTQLKLTGLKSNSPIGFMAALGAFRHVSAMAELDGVKLGWTPHGGQWCALLETAGEISIQDVVHLFATRLRSLGDRPEFTWSPAVKSARVVDWRERASKSLTESNAQNHELSDWFQSFGSELVHKDGVLKSTPLDMTVARQFFLAGAQLLTKNLAKEDKRRGALIAESFREALLGPWKYADDEHSLGWDPATTRMGAFTPVAPTKMKNEGVRAAVWFAMESLPFFPCFFERGLATCGFSRDGHKKYFHWAVWESPLSIAAVRTLVAQSVGIGEKERAGRGLCAMYSSAVYKPNKYLTSFQPAVLKA